MLYLVGIQPLANLFHPERTRIAIVSRRANLDQLVRLQRPVDFDEDFLGEPLVADDDDRIQLVRLRAKLGAA